MADDVLNKVTQDNPADAVQDAQTQTQTADTQQTKTFTQEELDRIINERLERERKKYADYNNLKKAAEELQKIKESQMTEQEKLQAKLAEYERQLLEKEREAAEARLETTKLRILDEMGLPKSWANRIFGTTEEEIRQDAEDLKRLLGTAIKTVGSGTNPPADMGIVNPWRTETFNLTMQAKIIKENPALAKKLITEAGVKI
ncbi:MAG: capsid assembly scaffolding protein Gp46 family protein [Fervidobacterium sp.]